MDKLKSYKFYYFAPHPVQYHSGIYRGLAKEKNLDFKVIYEDDIGLKPTYVEEFKKFIEWDIDLLDGYPHEFMKNYSAKPHGGFLGRVNPDIFKKFFIDKPDVILFKGYVNFSDWLIMLLAIVTRTKIIFRGEATLRGTETSSTLRNFAKKCFLKFWLKACDIVMFSCSGNKDYWKFYDVCESKMLPIPCAVDNEFFQNERNNYLHKKDEIKKDLGICEHDLVILFSGRFTSRKRPLDLLKAVSTIDHDNITLLFVGDGPERIAMEELSEKNGIKAIFVGFINQGEISKYYSVSDVGVVISSYDPSPKAMNEIMNFRLPIIVTNIVGTARDLVEDGKNGFHVSLGDIDSIAKKMKYFNEDRHEVTRMGQNSFDIVKNWNFTEDVKGIMQAIDYVVRKD